MAIEQQPNTSLLLTVGAVSGILLVVLIIGVQAWFLREVQREVRIKYEDNPQALPQPLTNLKLEQMAKINQSRWVDQSKGIVAIPIADAMKLIVANHGQLPSTQPAQPKG
jgi:hypothetical protein